MGGDAKAAGVNLDRQAQKKLTLSYEKRKSPCVSGMGFGEREGKLKK